MIKTHEELMAKHLADLRKKEKELIQNLEQAKDSLAVIRELIRKEEEAAPKTDPKA